MSISNIDLPSDRSIFAVDTRADPSKVLFLPAASNVPGRLITLKDFYGTANLYPFTVSTTGADRIDTYNSSILVSTSFQSIGFFAYETAGWSILTNQGATLPGSIPSPSYIETSFTSNATLYSVDVSTSAKIVQFPAASTIPGQTIIIKDAEGFSGSNNCTILVSTTGVDSFEYSTTSSFVLSENYGAWTFTNDGISSWFLTETYLNTLYINP